MPISTIAAQQNFFTASRSPNDFLTDSELVLFSNDFDPTKETLLADLDIVTQAGMAVFGPIVYSTPYIDPQGNVAMTGDSHSFIATGAVATPFTVYGWGITNASGTILFYVHKLDDPVAIEDVGQGLVVAPTIRYGD